MKQEIRFARLLQWVLAVACIAIGALHTDVHIRELSAEPYALELGKIQGLQLIGLEADVWKLWQGFSLMMGLLIAVIGLLNVSVLLGYKGQAVAPGLQWVMMLMLVVVIFAGANYFSAFQLYGGMIGLLVQSVALFLTRRAGHRTDTSQSVTC